MISPNANALRVLQQREGSGIVMAGQSSTNVTDNHRLTGAVVIDVGDAIIGDGDYDEDERYVF
jgi:hypothetical protein